MKRCIRSAKPHRAVFRFFARYYDAEEVIHKRIFWNWENISKCGLKFRPKIMKNCIINEKVHWIRKNLTEPSSSLFARYYDAEEVIHQCISWNWEDILKCGPKVRPKIMKNWIFNEKVHRISETSQSRFSLFCKILRCLKEVIHKSISWNWENISKCGHRFRPKIIKNWTFNEKVHRTRKTSQKRFSLFCKILRCWRSDSKAHFLKLRRYLKLWPQSYAKNYKKLNF